MEWGSKASGTKSKSQTVTGKLTMHAMFFQESRGFCQIVLWTVWPPGHTRRRLRPFSWGGPRAGLGGLFDPSAMKHG